MFLGPSFEESLNQLSLMVNRCTDKESLVGHDNMKAFVLHHSPTVYNTLLNSITSERHGAKGTILQEKRITSLIWHLLYFR